MEEPHNRYQPPRADLGSTDIQQQQQTVQDRLIKFAWAMLGTFLLLLMTVLVSMPLDGPFIWIAGSIGSLILALPGSVVATFLPTRRVWIYLPVSMVISVTSALVIGVLQRA